MSDFSEDAILRGLVRVVQPRRGYRFSLDALLLADFAMRGAASRIVDLGCGSAVIALILARRRPQASVLALEIQADLCEAARRGVELNGLASRVQVVEGDLRRMERHVRAGSFDLAVCNPPYFHPRRGHRSPSRGRAIARHALGCTVEDVLRASAFACRPGGRLALIYPRRDLPSLSDLHLAAVRPVASRAGRAPHRYLMELVRSGPGGEALGGLGAGTVEELPTLVVHEGQGYTNELRRILGDA